MTRKSRIRQIQGRIGKRKLVWFGTRGTDSRALFEIQQFSEVYSIITPINSFRISELSLESLKKIRVDLELYSLDCDNTKEALEFRRTMLHSLKSPAVVVTYRPGNFFSSIYYPNIENIEYLGLFHEQQAPFEHKPWVESELKKIGVTTVPWKYYNSDGDSNKISKTIKKWPIVIRANRSDGGAGLNLVEVPEDLKKFWPKGYGEFIGIAPFMEPNVPLNVNACVFPDGSLSFHSVSLQLIGIKKLTNRLFGYCGNDFSEAKNLDLEMIDNLEKEIRLAGKWLARNGYRGAFGVDSLVSNGRSYLTEINPRFQGSSDISSQMNREIGWSDMFLEHLAAFLDLPSPKETHLVDLLREQPEVSQVIPHNLSSRPLYLNQGFGTEFLSNGNKLDLLPMSDVSILSDAALCRIVVKGSATKDGHNLRDTVCQEAIDSIKLFSEGNSEM